MKQRRGPSKTLAPASMPEIACPHEFTEEEGLQLEIDCMTCTGPQDLLNRRCLIGAVNVMANGSVPDAVILRRFMHKRYRSDQIRLISMTAAELGVLGRALSCTESPSDRRCRTCPASLPRLLVELKRNLVEDPAAYFRERGRTVADLRERALSTRCENARSCIERALATSTLHKGGADPWEKGRLVPE